MISYVLINWGDNTPVRFMVLHVFVTLLKIGCLWVVIEPVVFDEMLSLVMFAEQLGGEVCNCLEIFCR